MRKLWVLFIGFAALGVGLLYASSGGTNPIDYLNYSFSGLPRWEESLVVQFFNTSSSTGRLGQLKIRNPLYLSTPVQWPVEPLPQKASFDSVEVRLVRLEFTGPSHIEPSKTGHLLLAPQVIPTVNVTEQTEKETLTNVWHVVNKSFFDNYGNNSHDGLPPKRPGDTNGPPIQWRIAVDLAGDHHSQVAPNSFLTLPPCKLPGLGERVELNNPVLERDGLKFWIAGWLGGGHAEYNNGTLTTNYVPAVLPEWPTDSSSATTDAKGNSIWMIRVDAKEPHLAIGYDPAADIWLSIRATDVDTGETYWLVRHSGLDKRPRFSVPDRYQRLVWFSCAGLDTNRTWRLSLGVHKTRRVEFFIDRPDWDGKL